MFLLDYINSINCKMMNRRKFLISSALLSLSGIILKKQNVFSAGLFDDDEIIKCKKKLSELPMNLSSDYLTEIIPEVGKSFLGTPYVAGTCDDYEGDEQLIIKITGLDCVTFVENTLTMSRMIQKSDNSYDAYLKDLQLIRYRNGIIDEYPSRLHYFLDWIYDNEEKNIVKNITKEIGGVVYDKKISFMTSHISSYAHLKNNPEFVKKMKVVEDNINSRNHYYLPKKNIDDYYDALQTGDVFAITTNIDGLDIVHTGFIYKKNSSAYLLHASLTGSEVMISSQDLKSYLAGIKKQTGVVISRPVDLI
jgi:hypothetical protein